MAKMMKCPHCQRRFMVKPKRDRAAYMRDLRAKQKAIAAQTKKGPEGPVW